MKKMEWVKFNLSNVINFKYNLTTAKKYMLMTIYATTNRYQVRSLLIGCLQNCNKQYKFNSGKVI